MTGTYAAPSLVQVGDFHQDTGELLGGPILEGVLPFDDYDSIGT